MTKRGRLYLIGCGPGAADLLTVRATRRIAAADLILYDRLVDPEVLSFARTGAELRYVGKRCGDGGVQQDAINREIVSALIEGRSVARLKSGDPMIFGRAAEEIATARHVGADVEIVPGVTSALAAAADATIPVTERGTLNTFIVTTGKSAIDGDEPAWAEYVKPGACVAFYMGVGQARLIEERLLAAGAPADAPADWIENAGRLEKRTVATTIGRLAADASVHGVQNPAILLVRRPLRGAIPAARPLAAE